VSEIHDFVGAVAGFYRKSAVDQLLVLAWYVESRQQRANFDSAYMRQCFRDVGVDAPNVSAYLTRLASKKPPQLIKEKGGYRLSAATRRDLDGRLGNAPTTIAVEKALSSLPAKLPNLAERSFLAEALNCYKVQAYRATIVMTWNLTYDHITHWIFANPNRLKALNDAIATRYSKKNLTVTEKEDFDELKESELIEALRTARLLDKNTIQILKDKLNRRNMAAHPSRVTVTQHQADDMITDLVANVILLLT